MTDRLYERISLDTERSGSITKQNARLMRQADPDDHEIYEERSVSGAKVPFAERPEGARLLRDLTRGDRVLVTKIDRAARNVRDLLGLVERIEAAGATIVFVDQNIDTAGPMGRFLLTLLGAVAELEAAIVAERLRETRESFRAEGRFAGGPIPFGFMTAPHSRGRGLALVPHPEHRADAARIVDRVLAGESQASLAPLIGLGEPGFSRWLRNPILAGIREGELVEDLAVLSLPKWHALQDHLSRPAKAWSRTDGYGGALRCGVCGERLYLRRDRRNPDASVYACGRRSHAPGQPSASVVRRHADAHIEAEFLAAFGPLPVIEVVETSTSYERDERIARARLALANARAAQDEAESDEADEEAEKLVRSARRALRQAEAEPATSTREERATGLTYAQTWETADDDERTRLLNRFGPFVVAPGRGLPIGEKVRRAVEDPEADYLAGQV